MYRCPISSSICRRPPRCSSAGFRDRADPNDEPRVPSPSPDYVKELNEAYQHFFFHYTATPLLVVETSEVDLIGSEDALDELLRQMASMTRGTRYYVPRP